MNKVFNHLKTVHTHRKAVRKMCFKCGLYYQGLVHDLSKYSPAEFISSVKYWTGKCSPIDMEIKEKKYSNCWLHHKGRNKHHFEYWYDPAHCTENNMPMKYIVEMFCDRVGACKAYMGDNFKADAPLNYLHEHLNDEERRVMGDKVYNELEYMLKIYANLDENSACKIIKNCLKETKL